MIRPPNFWTKVWNSGHSARLKQVTVNHACINILLCNFCCCLSKNSSFHPISSSDSCFKYHAFANFSCRFLYPNYFFQFEFLAFHCLFEQLFLVISYFLEIFGLQSQMPNVFFFIIKTFFSYSRSEQYWKQNTIFTIGQKNDLHWYVY